MNASTSAPVHWGHRFAPLWATGIVLLASIAPLGATETPALDLPVVCEMGSVCTVQLYVDHDEGAGAVDYTCGTLTYDGHQGTDIRVPDLVAMEQGVSVVAAAAGTVRAIRDGEPDLSVDRRGRAAVGGKPAGNAVVLVHGDGWETQYSHLKEGSVAVRPGQRVDAGERLGLIGLSGDTNFPHLEFGVRHEGKTIDPFVGLGPPAGCGEAVAPLWIPVALDALRYRPSGVLLSGFADEQPDKDRVRAGAHRTVTLSRESAALVFWADVYGLRAGDRAVFRLYDPAEQLVTHHERVIDLDGHQLFDYAGRKRPDQGWPVGIYRGEYELWRRVDGVDRVVARTIRRATLR
jgi:hypothetical protein